MSRELDLARARQYFELLFLNPEVGIPSGIEHRDNGVFSFFRNSSLSLWSRDLNLLKCNTVTYSVWALNDSQKRNGTNSLGSWIGCEKYYRISYSLVPPRVITLRRFTHVLYGRLCTICCLGDRLDANS